MKKALVILSGGLDSTVLLHEMLNKYGEGNVSAITFNYGQRHSKEIELAKKTTKKLNVPHEVLEMSIIGNQIFSSALMDASAELPTGKYEGENLKVTVVPNRNMIMVALAAGFAIKQGATVIAYGAHSGDHANYPDCRPEFIEALRATLALCHFEPIELVTPYANVTKAAIVSRGLELGVNFKDTWSCYAGGEKACGKCTTCNDRLAAFEANGVKDPIEYEEV